MNDKGTLDRQTTKRIGSRRQRRHAGVPRKLVRSLASAKAALGKLYGRRLDSIWLYGSTARGRAHAESDIDVLVVLRSPFEYFVELYRITHALYPVQLKTDRLIAALPAPAAAFKRGSVQLYRNVRREGMPV